MLKNTKRKISTLVFALTALLLLASPVVPIAFANECPNHSTGSC